MSEYIDFITYQDDAIYQSPLRYYRRRDNRIRDRRETFIRETGTEKTYHFQPPKESGHFRSRSFSVIKDFRLSKYPSIL